MISIIIPVYNVEKYITKCIESILNQTNSDWELILINDGSTDRSGEICDKYAINNKKIKVIHQSNRGVSKSRNTAINIANGEYLCFVDSDDWIDPNYLEEFKTNTYKADFYFSGALYDINNKVYSYKNYKESYCKNIQQIKNAFFNQKLFSNGYPWGKLFKTQIIKNNNLQFNEQLSIHEDHIFVFQYFSHINSLYITNTSGYHYIIFDDSGRKLSSKLKKYEELILATNTFALSINQLKKKWNLSIEQNDLLNQQFIFSKRLDAIRSLILQKKKKYFINEQIFWRNNSYIGVNKKEKILLSILRSNNKFKYLSLYFFIQLIELNKKINQKKRIYNDLNNRSTRF